MARACTLCSRTLGEGVATREHAFCRVCLRRTGELIASEEAWRIEVVWRITWAPGSAVEAAERAVEVDYPVETLRAAGGVLAESDDAAALADAAVVAFDELPLRDDGIERLRALLYPA